MRRSPAWWLLGLALIGCSGESDERALDEPIRVRGGQFRAGYFPVATALAPGDEGTAVTGVDSQNNIIYPGQRNKKLAGRATERTQAVALGFEGLGTGFWTVPTDVADPQTPGQLTWSAPSDFAADLIPGLHSLRFVGIDERGEPGGEQRLRVCVPSPTEGLHACDVSKALPAALVVLRWDAPVDLDLRLETPSGKIVTSKTPSTSVKGNESAVQVDPSRDGVLDRDSNALCQIDGVQREEVAWQSYPQRGTYRLRAGLTQACGQTSVRFLMQVLAAEGEGEQRRLVEKFSGGGVLLAIDEDQGKASGLFVSDFIF